MKRLLILFTVGLLSACGGVSTPATPVSPYLNVAGTWSDSTGVVSVCGASESTRMVMTLEQTEANLSGTFAVRGGDGRVYGSDFEGRISTSSRITGQVGSGEDSMDVEMSAGYTFIRGTLSSATFFDCVDGSQDRAEYTVSLERE